MTLGLHFATKDVLLIGASIVLMLPFVLWWLLGLKRYFPLAVVQIFAGVLLGPTFLGQISPDLFKLLFTDQPALNLFPATSINAIATVAVSLFAFNAGTEADLEKIRQSGPSVVAIGLGGLLFTWGFGIVMGLALAGAFPRIAPQNGLVQYAVAFGLCNAVPALPILAALLNELKISAQRLGQVALAAAGIGDAVLWAAIAVLLPFAPIANAHAPHWGVAAAVSLTGAILSWAFVSRLMGPMLSKLKAEQAPERVIMILVGVTIFGSASITAVTGLHAVMGAFIAGVFLPHDVREEAAAKLDMPTALILLPFFFLATGLKASFNFSSPAIWAIFGVGMIVCFFAKIVGSVIFARMAGETIAFGTTTGVLLQTKGLMELVIVTIFEQKGFVGPETFSALVAVALVSTALTMPVASFILSRARTPLADQPALAASALRSPGS